MFTTVQIGRKALSERASKKYEKGLPHDFACPTVQNDLHKRTCVTCGLYFGTITSLKSHKHHCAKQKQDGPKTHAATDRPIKVRPVRVAARRQRELMCIISYMENEVPEWYDESDVDMTTVLKNQHDIPSVTTKAGTPLNDIVSEPVWANE